MGYCGKCTVLLSMHFVTLAGCIGTENGGCLRLMTSRVLSLIVTTSIFVFLALPQTVFCCYSLYFIY